MITTNLPEVEPELNKNEKIIFEYLLNELEISNSKSLKLSLNSFKNDLDMIQNLFERIFEFSTKKIVVKDKGTGTRTLCFNIIDSYSIIDNNLLIVFSEPIYELFTNKQTDFHIYSLLNASITGSALKLKSQSAWFSHEEPFVDSVPRKATHSEPQ